MTEIQAPLATEPLSEAELYPRGVLPATLLAQVHATMPYLPHLESNEAELKYVHTLKHWKEAPLSHEAYFELCVSAHFASCGTFVPTDVDNQIRFKLWHPTLPPEKTLKMVETVLQAKHWDIRPVTTRLLPVPGHSELLSGHRGEWLTISAAAYGALRKRFPEKAAEVLELIQQEVEFEKAAFEKIKKQNDGVGLLKACGYLAHNFGDLQRVIDMWNLDAGDALFDFAVGAIPKEAFELYKLMMAPECHRYFAMRSAKCLRQSPDFLIPLGPFFDDWGKTIVKHPLLTVEEKAHVAECLIDGFAKLKNSIGYGRALCGMETHFAGGADALQRELPSRIAKAWKTGALRQICSTPKEKFEAQWAQKALKFVKDFRH